MKALWNYSIGLFLLEKMMKKSILSILALLIAMFANVFTAHAESAALQLLSNYAKTTVQTSCATCHSSAPALNAFGSLYRSLGGTKAAGYVLTATAQSTLLNADTDNDGTTNQAELAAGTNPAGGTSTTTAASNELAATTGCMASTSTVAFLIGMLSVIFGFTILTKRGQ